MNAVWIAVVLLLIVGWLLMRRGYGLFGGLCILIGIVCVAATPGPVGGFVLALCKGVPVGFTAYFHYLGSHL